MPKKTLEERFEGYQGELACEEYDWGRPVGKEILEPYADETNEQ